MAESERFAIIDGTLDIEEQQKLVRDKIISTLGQKMSSKVIKQKVKLK